MLRHLLHPAGEGGGRAVLRTIVLAVVAAAGFVRELPREDVRVVLVGHLGDGVDPVDQVRRVAPVRLPRALVRIELVVIAQVEPLQVLVHATKLFPVVGEHQHELDVVLGGL
jgi:hypothetical protein